MFVRSGPATFDSSVIQIGIGAAMTIGAIVIGTNAAARWRAEETRFKSPNTKTDRSRRTRRPQGLWRGHTCARPPYGKKSWFSGPLV